MQMADKAAIPVLISSGIAIILIVTIRAFNKKQHALESAEGEDNYGHGFAAFFRRLFHHPVKTTTTGLTDNQKTTIDMNESIKANTAYFKTLTGNGTMLNNARELIKEMKNGGITSPYSQAGVLAVVSKESNFIYKRENLNYDAAGLIRVFKLPADLAAKIAHQPELIANTVYMPPYNTQLGNTLPGEGNLYRGGGPNQTTGKNAYKILGEELGVDLVGNPDLIDDPSVAAKEAVRFFKDGFAALMKSTILLKDGKTKVAHSTYYHNPTSDINGFSNADDAAAAFYNINAGVGQHESFLLADVTGGRALCMARAEGFLDFIKQQEKAV